MPVTRALIIRKNGQAIHAVEDTTEHHLEASSSGARRRKKWIERTLSLAIGILVGVLGVLAIQLVRQIASHH